MLDVDLVRVVIDCLGITVGDAGVACRSQALVRVVCSHPLCHLVAHESVNVHRRCFHIQDLVPHLLVELGRQHLRQDVRSVVVRADLRD